MANARKAGKVALRGDDRTKGLCVQDKFLHRRDREENGKSRVANFKEEVQARSPQGSSSSASVAARPSPLKWGEEKMALSSTRGSAAEFSSLLS